ncbi:MAG: heat-inducible transcription repressor HrcA [Chloroflexi bacterium]|jgi:heat-inducible transcriptional repressor|nr:heat-inducible transcription repressor HrcA [Chloroflexota bacterium]
MTANPIVVTQPELTPRQQKILGLIVQAYINTATPVSSKFIQEMGDLGVSSATIRNEMATLEALGFLTHPHTSAGRVPTDKGYRYFVEKLIGDVELPQAERNMIRHQFHQAKLEMSQWMQLAAAILARSARSAALVTAPKLENPRLRHLELLSTQSQLVLLVVVFQGGIVRQRYITVKEPITQSTLSQIAAKFNSVGHNLEVASLKTKLTDLSEFEEEVLNVLIELASEADDLPLNEIYRDGLTEVLQEPEFVSRDEANTLVSAFEQPAFLNKVINAPVGTVQVVIGGEGQWRELSACSMVLARYGVEGFATGALGVLGPTRMPYGRAIGTVRYVADLMSDLVSELYVDDAASVDN